MLPRRPLRRNVARMLAIAASITAIGATGTSVLLVAPAQGGATRDRATQHRIAVRNDAAASLQRSARTAPLARAGRCERTSNVRGQGRSCRTRDGMYLVPRAAGAPMFTHGPDLVDAAPRRGRVGGFGAATSIVCSAPSRTRHVALTYLLPADYDGGIGAHGDRYTEVAAQMRQALYDAAAVVDARSGELAPGSHRRLRVLCDDDGQPTVERIVLPRSIAEYRSASGGFSAFLDDLERAGALPSYVGYAERRLPALRRVLAYYDADFDEGYAGQGTMFRRASLLRQGMRSSDPLISRTPRNINNNAPSASLAIQYGTSTAGVPDPPLYTSLLHELAHTMGAVQDEPPTSSDAGHCTDGLDLMCYADGGPAGSYTAAICPDPAPPADPADERFDCNGDTYFHPAPPVGSPLTAATTWHLGLPANETFSTATAQPVRPAAVTRVTAVGIRGATRRTVRWPAVSGARSYELAWRDGTAEWSFLSASTPGAEPLLKPNGSYQLQVAAVGPDGTLGARARMTLRTGARDDTPPRSPKLVRAENVTRTSARLMFLLAEDNVRVVRYRVERFDAGRWVLHSLISPPSASAGSAGEEVSSPSINGLRAGTSMHLRLRAGDARGNISSPSRALRVTTRR